MHLKEVNIGWSHSPDFPVVPEDNVIINIKRPEKVPKEFVLDKVGFSKDWITVTKKSAK